MTQHVDDVMFWVSLIGAIFVVLFAGAMSGLTLGLLGLDKLSLKIMTLSGPPIRRMYATKVLGLVKHHHILLVTLLVSNSLAMEILPLALENIMPEIIVIILSVTLVLLFGEVIPQAMCSRWGLKIGAYSSIFVRALMIFWLPISIPLGFLLDKILGKREGTYYSRPELKELLLMHGEAVKHITDEGSDILSPTEVTITTGALDLCTKVAQDAMIPIEKVVSIESHTPLDAKTLEKIVSTDYEEIPVYLKSPSMLRGVVPLQAIIKAAALPGSNVTIAALSSARPSAQIEEPDEDNNNLDIPCARHIGIAFAPWVDIHTPLCNVLIEMRTSRAKVAFVRMGDFELNAVGIITISNLLHVLMNAYEDSSHLQNHYPQRDLSLPQVMRDIICCGHQKIAHKGAAELKDISGAVEDGGHVQKDEASPAPNEIIQV